MTKSLFPVYSFANNNARSLASTPVLHIYTTLSSSGSNSTNCFTNWVKRSDTNPWVVVNFEICDVAVETTCRIITYFSLYYAFKHIPLNTVYDFHMYIFSTLPADEHDQYVRIHSSNPDIPRHFL